MGMKPRVSTGTKRFLLLTIGFQPPTPEEMAAWSAWFESMGKRVVDQGGFWGGGRELTERGVSPLPFGRDSTTGYSIFEAKDLSEAERLARGCPIVASNRLYEIMSK